MIGELKFRAWDRKLKCFLYFKLNNFGIELRKDMHNILSKDKDRDDLMQYTGLKDKNDKEIYEGDIVEWDDYIYNSFNNKCSGVVEYGQCKFHVNWYTLAEEYQDGHEDCHHWKDIEVIGNIYENPEMLEGEKRIKANTTNIAAD